MKERAIAWLETEAQKEIAGCRRTAADGTILFTPDGQGNYGALWTRDFAYIVENAYHLLDPQEVRAAILYLLHGQRADGCILDRVQVDGKAVYSAGPVDAPLGDPPTDNAQFMVDLVHNDVQHSNDLEFARQHIAALHRALDWVPRSPSGLVFIPPRRLQSPYGFTDTVAKSGELCFSSLLYWKACHQMAELCAQCGEEGATYVERATEIEQGLQRLWDAGTGAFRAATGDCLQLDVWATDPSPIGCWTTWSRTSRMVASVNASTPAAASWRTTWSAWSTRSARSNGDQDRPFPAAARSFSMTDPTTPTSYPSSQVITSLIWDDESLRLVGERASDNWPMAWGDDGLLYTAYGDSAGFGPRPANA
jgi:hypothetical protein